MEGKSYYITPYTVKSITGEKLDSIKREYDLLFEIYNEFSYLQENKDPISFEDNRKVVKVSELYLKEEERLLYGVIQYGEYGEEKAVINTKTGDTTHVVDKLESVMKPYYFAFYIPYDSEFGVFLSQKTGNVGIKTVMHALCKDRFAGKFPIYFYPLILSEVLESLFSNSLAKVRFVKYLVSKDIAETLIDKNNIQDVYEERHIIARRGKILKLNWLKELKERLIGGKVVKFAEILPLNDGESEEIDIPDEIKLEFKLEGNRRRTLTVRNSASFRSDYLLNGLIFGNDGHPRLDSIHSKALELLEVIKSTVFDIER